MRACWESISQRRFGSGGEGIIEIGSNDVVLPQLLFCFVPTGSEIRSMPQVRYFMCFYAAGTSFCCRTRCGCFIVALLSLFRDRCLFSLQLSLLPVVQQSSKSRPKLCGVTHPPPVTDDTRVRVSLDGSWFLDASTRMDRGGPPVPATGPIGGSTRGVPHGGFHMGVVVYM